MKRLSTMTLLVVTIFAVSIFAASCGVDNNGTKDTTNTTEEITTTSSTAPEETTTTETTQTVNGTITFEVYFSKVEHVAAVTRTVPNTTEVAQEAIKALLEGPTEAEENSGMLTEIPKGTKFLGLSIADGIAVVDFSGEYEAGGGSLSMTMRLAQVVFTLTQFPEVEGVSFKLDGVPVEVFGGEGIMLDKPVNRADYEYLAPAR